MEGNPAQLIRIYSDDEIMDMEDDSLYCIKDYYYRLTKFMSPYDEQFKTLVSQYNKVCAEIFRRENND